MAKRSAAPRPFDKRLVLNQYILSLFETDSFEKLAETLKDPDLEGFTADNITRFHEALTLKVLQRRELTNDLLRAYDENIVRHWRRITERRGGAGALYPKSFQYLSLLFAEIYLDRYFRDRATLLADLNAHVERFNAVAGPADRVEPYASGDLNKLAFWSATGSGKTLLMHVNILQYRHYRERYDAASPLNKIILLTPNEGLSRQHLAEMRLSGIEASLFSKDSHHLFATQNVEIIDINKLREEGKQKTVAIDAFEGNNLVMVDEGHRGSSGSTWKGYRDALCADGFSFEYSATFGQAMKAAKNPALLQEYARCILFDYSYKYFYRDGYGKDYRILNLADDEDEHVRLSYLTACLLTFYQQQRLYADRAEDFRDYLLERPLWVFVGGSVNAVRMTKGREISDVVDILLFLAAFVANEGEESVRRIDAVLRGRAGLRDTAGHEIFAHTFGYLQKVKLSAEEIFADILRLLFNTGAAGTLHVEHLKGTDGELALRVGDHDPFGLINVGDAAKLLKLCEEQPELATEENDFAGSLFRTIDAPATTVTMLIGSKKFTEGWNSWRVSTMGLMNVGRSEGSEIIQLFGRGVRLKGKGFCLKRSRHAVGAANAPQFVEVLETLNIFGIRADYMKQFREYLADEGLPSNENRIEFVLPTITSLGSARLKTLTLKSGVDFKRDGPKPTLGPPESASDRAALPVALDWYPKIQAEVSAGIKRTPTTVERNEATLSPDHLAFLDREEIYAALLRYKAERGWHNLNVTRAGIDALLAAPDWYRLFIPPEEMEFRTFAQVACWQEIAIALLTKYCEAFYKGRRKGYEMAFMEYRALDAGDPNFFPEYRFLLEESEEMILATLGNLKEAIERGELRDFAISNFHAITFDRHLYQPLIYLKEGGVEVTPVPLNEGERDFVLDLKRHCEEHAESFAGKDLYLLRNRSRGKGVGFFEAGNFYPDFILWLLDGERQYITFVDPKGLRNITAFEDPKIRFASTIKVLQERLGDPTVILNSYIISVTPFNEIRWWDTVKGLDVFEREHHILFPSSQPDYIARLIEGMVRDDIGEPMIRP